MERFNLQNHCLKTWQRIAVEDVNNGRGWFWLLLMKKRGKGMCSQGKICARSAFGAKRGS